MKQKFLYCFCALIIFTMTGCGGESNCNDDFFPLAAGNKWVYDVKENSNMYSGAYSDLVLTDTTCSALTYTIEIVSESEDHYIAAYRKKDAAGNVLEEKSIDFDKKEGAYLKDGRILLPTEKISQIPAADAVAMFYDFGCPDTADPGAAEYTFKEDAVKVYYNFGNKPVNRAGTILYRWKKIDDEYQKGIGLLRFSMNTGAGGCAGSTCGASGTTLEGVLKNYVINGCFYEVNAETETGCMPQ